MFTIKDVDHKTWLIKMLDLCKPVKTSEGVMDIEVETLKRCGNNPVPVT